MSIKIDENLTWNKHFDNESTKLHVCMLIVHACLAGSGAYVFMCLTCLFVLCFMSLHAYMLAVLKYLMYLGVCVPVVFVCPPFFTF